MECSYKQMKPCVALWTAMNKVVAGCVLGGASGLVWMGLFRLTNRWLTQHFQAKKWNISAHHTMNISEAIISSLQVPYMELVMYILRGICIMNLFV